jgi:hypothetical protein
MQDEPASLFLPHALTKQSLKSTRIPFNQRKEPIKHPQCQPKDSGGLGQYNFGDPVTKNLH